jgi:hypothetical protein
LLAVVGASAGAFAASTGAGVLLNNAATFLRDLMLGDRLRAVVDGAASQDGFTSALVLGS